VKTVTRWTIRIVIALIVLTVALGFWAHHFLEKSLPVLDGSTHLSGLSSSVTVERDNLGVPTIRGKSRLDIARALGFIHAQDRFFQMDLTRRRSAGELSELFGKRAVAVDKAARRNEFRALAKNVLLRASKEERDVVEAYTEGVNAGLSSLKSKPFEYSLLRLTPAPWKAEDCVLVAASMLITLQDDQNRYEQSLVTLHDTYGRKSLPFFASLITPDDAALDGSTAPGAPIPGPDVINIRDAKPVALNSLVDDGSLMPGSNSMAISGAHTTTGAAMVANDMHLEISVPGRWYRACFIWDNNRVTGVTLAGTPLIIAGSNGHVAWGFTNSCVDTADMVPIARSEQDNEYHEPGTSGILKMSRHESVILVKGSDPVKMTTDWTIWGPIIGKDSDNRPLALHWTGHMAEAFNFSLLGMEKATTADEAIEVAHQAGIPIQNILIADSAGKIAWTVAGKVPKRVGFDGRLTVPWVYGDRHWDGLLSSKETPVWSPAGVDYLWTANQRILGGEALQLLGDAGYARPARAAQIRDDLKNLVTTKPKGVVPKDLLSVQLDDRALALIKWKELLLNQIAAMHPEKGSDLDQLAEAVRTDDLRADASSTAYRLVREFKLATWNRVFTPIFAPCVEAYPEFQYRHMVSEYTLWTLIQQKPMHLLAANYLSWDDLLHQSVNDVLVSLKKVHVSPKEATWGKQNTLASKHPFSALLPSLLTRSLNFPADQMSGGDDMPRIQGQTFGASERFAVSPGHEEEGIFEMPGGQSAHPLSSYYIAGHEAWVKGEPTAFLPGKTEHVLTLTAQ
jgi:penicillin amidase